MGGRKRRTNRESGTEESQGRPGGHFSRRSRDGGKEESWKVNEHEGWCTICLSWL